MSFLRRVLGLYDHVDHDLQERAQRAERILERERQEYRKTIQRVMRGADLMETWGEANRMVIGDSRGKHSQ